MMTELKLVKDITAINAEGRNYVLCSILIYLDHYIARSFESNDQNTAQQSSSGHTHRDVYADVYLATLKVNRCCEEKLLLTELWGRCQNNSISLHEELP